MVVWVKKEKQVLKRILIIDDDDQFRAMLREMLERSGYEIVETSDGKEGLQRYKENPTDLVITDLIMPEKKGIETIQELKQDFPDVKIIAVSGGGWVDPVVYLHLAKMLGAQRTFAKPIEREDLLRTVNEILIDA